MATASVLQPYDVNHFNKLPTIHEATASFNAKNGETFVNEVFKPLLLKHNLESVVGIGLLHTHFSLKHSEQCVEFNNISVPWDLPATASSENELHEGKILPCAWLITEGKKLMPYEFIFSPLGRDKTLNFSDARVLAFLDEFLCRLGEHGLSSTLALRLIPQRGEFGGLEVTEGRANIMLAPGQFNEEYLEGANETMWFFPQGENGDGKQANCKRQCAHCAHCRHPRPRPSFCRARPS